MGEGFELTQSNSAMPIHCTLYELRITRSLNISRKLKFLLPLRSSYKYLKERPD